MKLNLALPACAPLLLSSCASIISGTDDKIAVTTTPPTSATCSASNALSQGTSYAPGTISGLKKSKTDLNVRCVDRSSGAEGTKTVESEFDFLTILGGIIGLGVDAGTGAMWDYPQDVSVPLNVVAAPAAPAVQYFTPAPAPTAAPAAAPAAVPTIAPLPFGAAAPAPAAY